jgi:hypothetical protein
MAESVSVRCPACRREHAYSAPTFPCACGTPLTLPLLRGGVAVQVRHRSWDDSWVSMRCPDCARKDEWPQPEFGCPCGATIRAPVDSRALAGTGPLAPGALRPSVPAAGACPERQPAPPVPARGPSAPRPPFRPVTIRTARDALTAAAQYLKWLGFESVRIAGDRTASGLDLRGDGIVAQIDPTTRPTMLRDIECLWLNCLNEDTAGAFFSLAGYAQGARLRADQLGVPLFVMDLTGTPQPVNDAADQLIRGEPQRGR